MTTDWPPDEHWRVQQLCTSGWRYLAKECTTKDEAVEYARACWERNRSVHFRVMRVRTVRTVEWQSHEPR